MGVINWLEKRIDLSDIQSVKEIYSDIEERFSAKALAFQIASSYVIDTLCKCEIKHFVKGQETKDEFYYLLNVSPNVNQNAFELKKKYYFKLFFDGEALMFEHKGNLYVADSFSREKRPLKGDLFVNISLDDETKTFTKKAEDVFYLNLEDGKLRNLVYSMLEDYSEMSKHAFDIYKSSNSEKYKLVMDNVKTGDKNFKEQFENTIKKQLESFLNQRKSVYPQFSGYSLERIVEPDGTTNSTDVIALRKEAFEVTAEAFKIPVSLMYGNMTNIKDIVSSLVTFAIEPYAKMYGEELTRKTGTYENYADGTYFRIDTTSILHRDIYDIAVGVSNMISNGVYCIDEIRKKLGEDPLDTEFSKQHWMTKNFSKIEDALEGENQTVSTNVRTDTIETERG